MNSFAKPRPSIRECVTCERAIKTNGTRHVMCEECRTRSERLRTWSGDCREVTVETLGVTVTKSVGRVDDDVRVEYRLSSDRDEQVRFHLEDHLPDAESGPASSGESVEERPTCVDVTWWIGAKGELSFARRIPSDRWDETSRDVPVVESVPILGVEEYSGDRTVTEQSTDAEGAETQPLSHGRETGEGKVVAAVPAYNEAAAIGDVVSAIKRHVDAVLVVDDGSQDDTSALAWEAGAFVRRHDPNRGYGASLQTIFAEAAAIEADHLVIIDGDGQHDPDDIPALVDEQRRSGAELVIGNRFGNGDTVIPAYRRFGLGVINVLTNMSMRSGTGIEDTQSGFRAYSRQAIETLAAADIGDRMEISSDILYHAYQHDYDVAEVGTTITYEDQTSSHNPVRQGMMVVSNLLPMLERERPLSVLALPGVLVTLGGLGIAVTIIEQFATSGSLDGPLLFGSLILALVGFLASLSGIVLHSVRRYHGLAK